MKLSVDWLKTYIDFDCPLKTLADGLTMAGLEVEEQIDLSKADFERLGGGGVKDDTVFDVKVTPNRGDWLSIIGVAREAGPLVGKKIKLPEPGLTESAQVCADLIKIRIDAPDLCRRYAGIVVRNVKVQPSPDWMKDRLIAAGMRPINNIVDVTNYVMLELGQPLHAFDLSLLHGSQIIVRRAANGETITSLDDIERKLDSDMLVIADADRPVAIAGIMGGEDSEISEQTKDILIESANFNSVSVRRTSKRLGMSTESSYRFERGVDPSITALAALRAAELVQQAGGGEVCKDLVDVCPAPIEPLKLKVRPQRVNDILGVDIDSAKMAECLMSIEIGAVVGSDGMLEITVPTFRPDVGREIDVIEEIGRVYGYDNLPMTLPDSSAQGKDSPQGMFRSKLRYILMAAGAQEALTHSVVDIAQARLIGREDTAVVIRNPLVEDLNSMRAMIAPNLLQVIERNQAFGTPDVSVFEIGKVYFNENGKIGEKLAVGGAIVGSFWNNGWGLPLKVFEADFFTCKGMVESLLDALCITNREFIASEDPILHPTRAAKIIANNVETGIIGEVAPSVRDAMGVRGRPIIFELDFDALMAASPKTITYQEPPRYPAMQRHIAAVVSDSVPFAKLAELVKGAGEGLIEEVDLLDVYKGEQIGKDMSSLTLGMVFRSREKTLTDDEVNAVIEKVRDTLTHNAGATFR